MPKSNRKSGFPPNGCSDTIHTVFSGGSGRTQWEGDVLAYSHRKVNQEGPITRCWSDYKEPTPFDGNSFWVQPMSPHPDTGDDYAPFNKPSAIDAWLKTNPPESTILILDPDCIFVHPITQEAVQGFPIGNPMTYMAQSEANSKALIKEFCSNPSLVASVGIPILINKADLIAVAPLWMSKTEAIRKNPFFREKAGWIAEMWAYSFACADIGLQHSVMDLAQFQGDDFTDRPITHYCYHSEVGEWKWNKRDYKPWEIVPNPPPNTPNATVQLIQALNEYAMSRSS